MLRSRQAAAIGGRPSRIAANRTRANNDATSCTRRTNSSAHTNTTATTRADGD